MIEVASATLELDPVDGRPTGRYTVVYQVGLDPEADPAYRARWRSS